ncbi:MULTISPECIES: hypothetical protein [Thermococcus]|uniref:Uncharacterized protein n=1 Tax=Thermococcus nautili TaxID=195522 RepID=W8P2G7_9EURY|nr:MULTISPECIES: hypothetical protein [Thermococcus]AHL22981.1 hypothetical protein BD01_1370 [Thermococcus nautili]NJE49526.1 hypothetical protein [Thermococcus sp. 9N3]CAI1492559.1 conserved protein of unknown function [Thermococcus nautili]
MKRRLCREYIEEIERLERSIRELEEEIIELRMQLKLKVDEANRLAIENASLRHKLEMQKKTYQRMVELLKKMKFPIIFLPDDE